MKRTFCIKLSVVSLFFLPSLLICGILSEKKRTKEEGRTPVLCLAIAWTRKASHMVSIYEKKGKKGHSIPLCLLFSHIRRKETAHCSYLYTCLPLKEELLAHHTKRIESILLYHVLSASSTYIYLWPDACSLLRLLLRRPAAFCCTSLCAFS